MVTLKNIYSFRKVKLRNEYIYVSVDGIGVMCVKILPLARTSGFTFVTDLETTTGTFRSFIKRQIV